MKALKATIVVTAIVVAGIGLFDFTSAVADKVYDAYVRTFKFHCPPGQHQAHHTLDVYDYSPLGFGPPDHKVGDVILIEVCWPDGKPGG